MSRLNRIGAALRLLAVLCGAAPAVAAGDGINNGGGSSSGFSAIISGTTPCTGCASGGVLFNNGGVVTADSGLTYGGAGGPVTIAAGTIAANQSGLVVTQTWNNVAATFDAPIFVNVTNTASAPGSLLADLSVGGAKAFTVSVLGNIVQNGNAAATTSYTINAAAGQSAELFLNAAGVNYMYAFGNSGGGGLGTTQGSFFLQGRSLSVMQLSGAVSAVNSFHLSNAATGGGIQLGATGSDTNITMFVQSQGTGSVAMQTAGATVLEVTGTQFVKFNQSSNFVAATNCGSLASSTGCLKILDNNGNLVFLPVYGTL